jgi:CubicO group peptidase (beta-lactamase class C family)
MKRFPVVSIFLLCFLCTCIQLHAGENGFAENRTSLTDLLPFECTPERDMYELTGMYPAALDSFLVQYMATHHIPGLSASIVKNGDVIWTGTHGNAYFDPFITVGDTTLFMLASISKTLTGSALMQLWEEGMFGLHDPINDYLPFDVMHPVYPDMEITFHMLLTHTSAIKDNWDVMFYFPGDSPLDLGEYLEDYLVPGGEYYDESKNFYNWEPGTNYAYCNIAIALVGYLIEVIAGIPFADYTQENLFDPLDMYETKWFKAQLDTMHIAMPFHWNGNEYEPYGHFGYTDYPAGQLRTSAPQLLRFLTCYLQHGELEGARILDSTTVAMMTTSQVPDINPSVGLIWHSSNLGGRYLWGHGGGDFGVRTLMYYCPDENTGAVVLTNGEYYLSTLMDLLLDYASWYGRDLSVQLEPHNHPIRIPKDGGQFGYDMVIINDDTTSLTFDAWISARLPNGSMYGPIVDYRNLSLSPGDTLRFDDLTQRVHASAPPGEYTLTAGVGQYSAVIVATDSFTLTKLPGHVFWKEAWKP